MFWLRNKKINFLLHLTKGCEFLLESLENDSLSPQIFVAFHIQKVFCVYSLELPHCTQHTFYFMADQKISLVMPPKLVLKLTQGLELTLSRINFYGTKGYLSHCQNQNYIYIIHPMGHIT